MIYAYYHAPTASEGSDRMRGSDQQTSHMFSYVGPEQRVRADHPLRAMRRLTDEVLATLSPRFDRMYSDMGRPSPVQLVPEQARFLRALAIDVHATSGLAMNTAGRTRERRGGASHFFIGLLGAPRARPAGAGC